MSDLLRTKLLNEFKIPELTQKRIINSLLLHSSQVMSHKILECDKIHLKSLSIKIFIGVKERLVGHPNFAAGITISDYFLGSTVPDSDVIVNYNGSDYPSVIPPKLK